MADSFHSNHDPECCVRAIATSKKPTLWSNLGGQPNTMGPPRTTYRIDLTLRRSDPYEYWAGMEPAKSEDT